MLTNDLANALLSFFFGASIDQVDVHCTNALAKLGLIALTIAPFRCEPFVMGAGEDALIAWLADDDLARWMGLLPAVTIRSASLPEMTVSVRLFDQGVEARRNSDAAAYHRARLAEDECCAWAGPWLRGWHAADVAEVA